LDSASEPSQLEEKKDDDFFTATLNADNSNCSEENEEHFKVQAPQVSFC
jgi:hypothetical protein